MFFTRPMTARDWDHLQYYAKRVLSISGMFEVESAWRKPPMLLSREVLSALSRCPIAILFPKLRALDLYMTDGMHCRLIGPVFSSPRLRSLKLYGMYKEVDFLLRYAPDLATSSPLLEVIDLDLRYYSYDRRPIPNPEPDGEMSKAVQSWQHLHSVKVGPVDEDMLLHIRRLPALQSLFLQVARTSKWLSSKRIPSFDGFKKLTIASDRGSTAVRALERILSGPSSASLPPRLSSIVRVECQTLYQYSLLPFTAALQRLCTHDLVDINLTYRNGKDDEDWPQLHPGHFEALYPLTSFRNLVSLRFWLCEESCDLSATQLLDLIGHWPRLEVLRIDPFRDPIDLPTLTQLMQSLPLGRDVAIPTIIVPADLEEFEDSPDTYPSFPRVTHLRLTYEEEGLPDFDPEGAVASLLYRIVPSIQDIQCVFGEEEDYLKVVMNTIKALRQDGTLPQDIVRLPRQAQYTGRH
ncbi:hypothetical protein CONPUDRAFT_144235 [Coniophora puteana RWD-64-598 SS2]|uniref:F-box domain-containing protein n=1 Tax=Coniophora puteana (strain RWD-64-598) TaxID=741705 RepID=A0A5M3MQN5_CONPW|nr:uncharacterized protein CONPUDRAFT_144235 [Coniophora puteana RWD-64-598 SS2]EIW81483.1 hypothetical protein CONPUDRAFT_144235 [Coniophora puteana RWD-64-598 SS2]